MRPIIAKSDRRGAAAIFLACACSGSAPHPCVLSPCEPSARLRPIPHRSSLHTGRSAVPLRRSRRCRSAQARVVVPPPPLLRAAQQLPVAAEASAPLRAQRVACCRRFSQGHAGAPCPGRAPSSLPVQATPDLPARCDGSCSPLAALRAARVSRSRWYLSVPCNWGTHSYCAKTRVVIRNYALRS